MDPKNKSNDFSIFFRLSLLFDEKSGNKRKKHTKQSVFDNYWRVIVLEKTKEAELKKPT
jgi:hypothetical protein